MCRKKLTGVARSFLGTLVGMTTFQKLRQALINEFGRKMRASDVHRLLSTRRTTHAIKQKYWILHLERKVAQVVNSCVKCIMFNKKLGHKEGFLNCIDKGDTPLHTLHMNYVGPMDATAKQYKYVLTVVDGFSKFVWLFPTKTTSGEETLRKLEVWSSIFGNPARVISDRGSAFTSQIFSEHLKKNGIDHVRLTLQLSKRTLPSRGESQSPSTCTTA
ncbi:uncharacterized protein LOC120901183 [Anopheles arabiensis]|uniref:uncharacterized protein LOC120901183 n=1 Tax=Anopheles arabiensis TaxID=7173 RepID=UPI001AADB3DA|nr:uncharacterized protein LOC120901183 [Anopheles arabiensis]